MELEASKKGKYISKICIRSVAKKHNNWKVYFSKYQCDFKKLLNVQPYFLSTVEN